MTPPELRSLDTALRALPKGRFQGLVEKNGQVHLAEIDLARLAVLLDDPVASLWLFAAADLNRTALRSELQQPDVQLVAPSLRRAFVVRSKLLPTVDFSTVVELALQRRAATLGRNANAATETLFRERLAFEGVPIRMSGAWTSGLLVDRRKPDGVYPDPETGLAPELYLEVKKVNRVRDDIQKRLYEIAEASLEVKFLYGALQIAGLNLGELLSPESRAGARASLRAQVVAARPVVVALLICRAEELDIARRYRPGAEAFVDRLYFADEIDECLAHLAEIAPPFA